MKKVIKMDDKIIDPEDCNGGDEQLLKSMQDLVLERYPQLRVRWSRILGRRWSHISGNSSEAWLGSRQYRLNSEYGISIDNADNISEKELESLINQLRENMADEKHG